MGAIQCMEFDVNQWTLDDLSWGTTNSSSTAEFSLESCMKAMEEGMRLTEKHQRSTEEVEKIKCGVCGKTVSVVGNAIWMCEHLADELKQHTTLVEGPSDPNPLMEMRIVVLKD